MDNLSQFRSRIHNLYRRVSLGNRRATQGDLAVAVGLSRTELNRRLHHSGQLTCRDVQAIVRQLAAWGAISTRAEADELLALLDCASFTAAEWLAEPLDRLAASVAAPPVPAVSSNLPSALTSFVGRETEVVALSGELNRQRLLTLTGPGGAGKTRLALELARQVAHRYSGGAWLVELASLNDPALLPLVVAGSLGLREQPGQSLLDQLIAHLRPRKLLLVLDNCEHLVEAVAAFAYRLLTACPDLQLLATSRERLHVAGEFAWPLLALALPAAGRNLDVRSLRHYAAIRLFVERAAVADPTFSLRPGNAATVQMICERLDGLPLAIELAAARLRLLSLTEIAAQLTARFQLLSDGPRSSPVRHQTLWATVAWSYDLLTPAEQTVFRCLAVFTSGFDLAAAAAVCADQPSGAVLLNLLAQLVDKSLLRRADQPDDSIGGGKSRFVMLETIREYAVERLVESGMAAVIRGRHLTHYLLLAEAAADHLRDTEQIGWLARLEVEHDNLRAALAASLLTGRATDDTRRLATALWRFWYSHSHISEGRGWLTLVLRDLPAPSPSRIVMLNAAATFATMQGDYAAAGNYAQEGLSLAHSGGDRRSMAAALGRLGTLAAMSGDYETARRYGEQDLTIRRELGDEHGIVTAINQLSATLLMQEQWQAARALLKESLSLGDDFNRVATYNNLGWSAIKLGDYAEARQWQVAALQVAEGLHDREGLIIGMENLAHVELAAAHAAAAARLLATAAGLRTAINAPIHPSEQADYDALLVGVRAALSEAEFAAAWARGAAMSPQRVVASVQ